MPTIDEAVFAFLSDLSVGQSKLTVETYSQGLARFKEFLASEQHLPADPAESLTVDLALACARWLSEKERLAKASLRTYLSSISRFYAYLLREGIINLSASDLERMHHAYRSYRRGYSRPLPKLPPDDDVEDLMSTARRTKVERGKPRLELARLRNIAMVEALRSSGMRVGELVGLKRGDLDYRSHAARVTGKGGKQRIVYFDDAAWNAMETYLKARKDGAKARAMYELPVFARHDRRSGKRTLPLTTDGVRLVFGQLVEHAEIETAMTPHSLRHAFATRVLEATGDLALVQDMLGHASPATTRIYAQVSPRRMRDAHRAAFHYSSPR